MAAIGTKEWTASGDRLSRWDRMRLLGGVASSQVRFAADRALLAAGVRRRVTEADVASIPVVDTADALAAAEEVRGICDLHVVLHSERSYRFAWLMSRYEGLEVDPEDLYVCSMLHDVGLAECHRPALERGDFAIVGAQEAERFLDGRGWDTERTRVVADAIGTHLNPRVPASREGNLARLLSLGPALDYFGFGAHRVEPAAARAVIADFPRPEDATTMLGTVTHGPGCRPAFLMGLGVGRFIARNPLDRPPVVGDGAALAA